MEFIKNFFNQIDLPTILILIVVLTISIVGHEIAHARVAAKYGDDTAKLLGRLSINPIKHIDFIGTLIVPALMYLAGGVLFGWAKPVPVRMQKVFDNGGHKACIAVALAGISYNILLTISATIAFKLVLPLLSNIISSDTLRYFAMAVDMTIRINLILALFNLYPLPQLDGSKVLTYLLDWVGAHDLANKFAGLDRFGFIILAIIILSPLSSIIFSPIYTLVNLFYSII